MAKTKRNTVAQVTDFRGLRTDRQELFYKALASRRRLKLLRMLLLDNAPLTAQQLASRLGIHVGPTRRHLSLLIRVGFVEAHGTGQFAVGRRLSTTARAALDELLP